MVDTVSWEPEGSQEHTCRHLRFGVAGRPCRRLGEARVGRIVGFLLRARLVALFVVVAL